jgi:hypothetical protein
VRPLSSRGPSLRGAAPAHAAHAPRLRPLPPPPCSNQAAPATDYILPFPANTLSTSAICMSAPTMEYLVDLAMYDEGRVDAWNTARDPGMGMSYMTRADLPYYYTLYGEDAGGVGVGVGEGGSTRAPTLRRHSSLIAATAPPSALLLPAADSFTAGDHYHQSTFTCVSFPCAVHKARLRATQCARCSPARLPDAARPTRAQGRPASLRAAHALPLFPSSPLPSPRRPTPTACTCSRAPTACPWASCR